MNSQILGELASDQKIDKVFDAFGYSIPVGKDGRRMWPTKFKREMVRQMISGKLSYPGLTLFLEDGELEIDNNSVENAMRSIALLRKNAMFAGSELGAKVWMAFASIIRTCEMNNIDIAAYLIWFYEQVSRKLPLSRYHELLPWKFPKKPDDE